MTISDEKYVLLTTLRKSGAEVPTPVWIAALPGNRAGFTTDLSSGKVKRIRNNPAVTLQACNMRGKVNPGAPVVNVTASVVTGADAKEVSTAISGKYPVMSRLIGLGGKLGSLVKRKPAEEPCAVVLHLS
jgi:uncharacterized protein